MTGYVFISYGRTDRRAAHAVARQLDERGFSVWWDPKIDAGVAYDRVIEAALAGAACVVVLWSAHSVESDWVRAEADDGRKRGLLVPALIEPVNPPLQFRLLETIDLTHWAADDDPVAFDRFCSAIAHHTAPADRLTRWKDGLRSGTGLHTAPLGPHDDWVSSVRFLDDHSAMTTTGDGTVRVWDLVKGIELAAFSAHAGTAWCCDGDRTFLVTGGADKTVRIWDRDGYAARPHVGRPRRLGVGVRTVASRRPAGIGVARRIGLPLGHAHVDGAGSAHRASRRGVVGGVRAGRRSPGDLLR